MKSTAAVDTGRKPGQLRGRRVDPAALAEIRELLGTVKSSEEICRTLIDRTLERGASDNVTVVAGRLRERTS